MLGSQCIKLSQQGAYRGRHGVSPCLPGWLLVCLDFCCVYPSGHACEALPKPCLPKPCPLKPLAVAEEDQKEEVRRGIFQWLQKQAELHTEQLAGSMTAPRVSSAAAAPSAEAGAGADGCLQDGAAPAGTAEGLSEPNRAEGAGSAAGKVREKMVVPFTPITLVCRNIRWVHRKGGGGMAA